MHAQTHFHSSFNQDCKTARGVRCYLTNDYCIKTYLTDIYDSTMRAKEWTDYSLLRGGETLTSVEALLGLMLTGANCSHPLSPDQLSEASRLPLKLSAVIRFLSKALQGDNSYFFTVVLQYSTVMF